MWGTKDSLQTTALLQRARADTLLALFFTRGPLHVSPAEPDLLSDHLSVNIHVRTAQLWAAYGRELGR